MKQSTIPLAFPLLAFLSSCEDRGPQIDIESAIPVRVEAVTRGAIAEFATATGTARAQREGDLQCLESGAYQLQDNPRTGRPFASLRPAKWEPSRLRPATLFTWFRLRLNL